MMLKEKSSPWARAKYATVLPLAAFALLGFAQPEFTNLQAQSAGEFDQLLSWTDVSAPASPSSTPSPSTSQNPNTSPQDKSSGNSEKTVTTDERKAEEAKPLIVLDGVIISPAISAGINFRTATEDQYAKAMNIDPANIKEISVLKGDAAISLYGEMGRNGVLVINTNTQKPTYPGGDEALMKFIRENIKYPKVAMEKVIQGQVICSFMVDSTGKVTNIKVTRGVDPALDTEAVRIISIMPNWIPGKRNDKNCALQYALPIVFKLKQNQVTEK